MSIPENSDVVYNRLTGGSLDRLAGLSDGVFAFALTVLGVDIRVPETAGIHSERELWLALAGLAPRFAMYLASFMTLGIFWNGQQAQLNHCERSDRDFAWIHIVFLAIVALLPFSTGLLAEFIFFRVALIVYWLNILALGIALYASWHYAVRAGLVRGDIAPGTDSAIRRRILVAQALYALGALLCLASTIASIAFIVAVQLNYALAPRIRPLFRI